LKKRQLLAVLEQLSLQWNCRSRKCNCKGCNFYGGEEAGVGFLTAKYTGAGTFSFDINTPATGTYKVTVYGKCSPNGVDYALKNSADTRIGGVPYGPSNDWVQAIFNVSLTEGSQSLSFSVYLAQTVLYALIKLPLNYRNKIL
jgi:hypothetical protein